VSDADYPVPPELKDLFDDLAGFEHSADGRILRGLGQVLQRHAEMVRAAIEAEAVLEYGQRYSSGGYLTFNQHPEILRIFPLAEQIAAGQMGGGKVGRRRILVLDDWKCLRKGAKQ
jgi:hypothetical protein